ncbi:hypothetical protein B0T24DRAFT_659867 [Lasiosphaeria ovina]|uniref:Aminoglycoside phosphotransferase domain-containing protein n=1 Tax=Lasiosphaeria ovina TaxID=92902 RepID=A0AAE0JVM8_9PEZI|nr:hypothetical protein B0T24DRAFT_659867 [Lasiosphaeria ovina]
MPTTRAQAQRRLRFARKEEAAKAREEQERREKERLRLENRKTTTLYEYLRNCHSHLYNRPRLADASMSSTGSTEVLGKYYPKWLRPWSEFETHTIMDLAATIARQVAGNESAIEYFEKLAVEDPVAEIVGFLATEEKVRVAYDFAGIRFSGNLLELTQASDRSGVADDETSEGSETLAFVYDYKAAHKVAIEHLRPAVGKEQLFFEVIARVNGAEASVAMALTQVFDYMITYGISYGYVAAGRSLLLLYVDRNDPQTLYCHPCLPDRRRGGADRRLDRPAFCLLSFQSDASSPYEDAAYPWLEPAESSPMPSSQATDGSEFVSTAEPTGRNPAGDDEEDHSAHDTSRSLPANKRKGGPSSGSEDEDVVMVDSPTRQYCTQACLLGLKRGKDLDENCPNVSLHRSDFTDLVNWQLLRNPYRKCRTVDFWGKRGAIGWLFKLELLPYGYTFHEGQVYARLDHLQGEVVPVHLGLVCLDPGYILPGFRFTPGASTDDAETLKKKSLTAIWREGVDHGDDYNANYLWNAERCRIMIIDFDRARLFPHLKPQASGSGHLHRRLLSLWWGATTHPTPPPSASASVPRGARRRVIPDRNGISSCA